VTEVRLFPEGTVPEYTTAEWYEGRERAPHLEQEEHQPRLAQTAVMVAQVVHLAGLDTVTDLGAGDGGLLSMLTEIPNIECWGYDLSPQAVAGGLDRGVDVRFGDVLTDPQLELGQLVVATEFLEHLVDPHGLLRDLSDRGVTWLVASSPWVETRTEPYEFHTWAWDVSGYAAMLEGNGWQPIAYQMVGPFQVWVAHRV
jgi:hypothetical protein